MSRPLVVFVTDDEDRDRAARVIASTPLPFEIRVAKRARRRSLEQNARYWALLTAISQQAPASMDGQWYAPEIWHEHCCKRFLGMEPGPFGDGVAKGTSGLSVAEFGDYMAEVEAWAVGELGINFEEHAHGTYQHG
jgi:hypothetical protein